ncbi:MAG: hypothetical protein Kow00108_27140 [Calditrichia bacterium]
MMFLKPKKPRRFEYTPLFYDPDKERKKSGRREIKFRRLRGSSSSGVKSFWVYFILFIIVLIAYWYSQQS